MGQPVLQLYAEELRQARTDAGLSQEALAGRIHFSTSLVAHVEQRRRHPNAEFTARCDEALNTGGRLERIRKTAIAESLVPWFQNWALIEAEATDLKTFEPLVVPGLLQTEEYIRAQYRAGARFYGDELERQVEARLARQEILTRGHPPRFVFVLDEYVLRRPFGSPTVMRHQLARLLEVADLPNVQLQVVPASVGPYPGLDGSFVLASWHGADVCYLESRVRGIYLERAEDVASFRDAWESIRGEAASCGQTVELIREAMNTWT